MGLWNCNIFGFDWFDQQCQLVLLDCTRIRPIAWTRIFMEIKQQIATEATTMSGFIDGPFTLLHCGFVVYLLVRTCARRFVLKILEMQLSTYYTYHCFLPFVRETSVSLLHKVESSS